MHPLEKIQAEITALGPDIRAEALVTQLLQSGTQWAQLVVHTSDFFQRRFSRDISRAEITDTAGVKDALHIHLSRTGLYDLLPEGIFFTPVPADKSPKNAGEMAEEYRVNQKQEAAARRFFAPFEHEFFRHRVNNFTAEVALLKGLRDEQLNRYFIRFWNLPDAMPVPMAIKLIMLLPYVHQVTGDAGLMASCLQTITGQPVSCRLVYQSQQQTGLFFNTLGSFQLGNELTCGERYFEEEPCFVFTIYLETAATDYLPGGKLYPVLETFRRFFVPVQAEVVTEIQLPKQQEALQPGELNGAILGVGTVLNEE